MSISKEWLDFLREQYPVGSRIKLRKPGEGAPDALKFPHQRRHDLILIVQKFPPIQRNAILVHIPVVIRLIQIGGERHIEPERLEHRRGTGYSERVRRWAGFGRVG